MLTIALSLSLLITSLEPLETKAAPTYLYHVCSNETTFAPNSTYQSNLNHLLSSLSSNATTRQFHSAAAAAATRDPSYGLFLCRGDVSTSVCRECVVFGVNDVVQRCPVEKEAVIWYDECLLRYSNRSFVGTMDQDPRIFLGNTANVTDQSRFNELLAVTMKAAAAEAAKGGPEEKFATRVANFSGFQTLYSLVQCTPDLSSSDCNLCLDIAIGNLPACCDGKIGGRVLMPSCNVRYELYPFFNQTASSPPSSATPPPSKGSKISSLTIVAIVGPISVSIALFIFGFCLLRRSKKKNKYNLTNKENDGNDDMTTIESLQFDLPRIEAATRSFSFDCKLGEGGFGEVYKGTLLNGQEIAVKRLSKSSVQGLGEFKNEVVLLARLQHRNLVRLLGFCFEGEEKLLVYEFVPNKSLDYFLYDPEKQRQLDWARRYKIIEGIARGMLYLHEDSRLRIIHRDLKASNILLDAEMKPKISDFGMARIFAVDQTRGNTSRIVGTYGYMSPEYAMHGQFSVKSDVYSFGVLVLEIISGKKNSRFYQSDGDHNDLLSYAWKIWKEGTPSEFLDPTIVDSYSENEVSRCIHMGLLCVQENPEMRPTMATIVLMLNSYSVTLPVPQQPVFSGITETDIPIGDLKSKKSTSGSTPLMISVNEASITELYPR
ncbi:Cysteine rich receptor like kinase [Trema orientale]|uniref:Cysteine rich receptor like kinase n=1 Tax=Trema orientale TaxID=63057 RepID=A0A2P5ERI1_TREOI|nr:Cysteine rich receptor like kinase [Trema orientale]